MSVVDVDFKRQREINEVLRCNNPVAKVLNRQKDQLLVPESRLVLFAPSQLSRDKDGNLVSVPFQMKKGDGSRALRAKQPAEGSSSSSLTAAAATPAPDHAGGGVGGGSESKPAAGAPSPQPSLSSNRAFLQMSSAGIFQQSDDDDDDDDIVLTSKDFASIVISERKLLAVKNTRQQQLLKRLLHRELAASQLRVKTCRNGGAHPLKPSAAEFSSYINPLSQSCLHHTESPIPHVAPSQSPSGPGGGGKLLPPLLPTTPDPQLPSEAALALSTLGGELDRENCFASFDDLDGEEDPGLGMVKVSSFFFTQPEPLGIAPSAAPTRLAPLRTQGPGTAVSTAERPQDFGASDGQLVLLSDRHSDSQQQKRRDEFLRFPDVSCCRILARNFTPDPEPVEPSGSRGVAGGGDAATRGRSGSVATPALRSPSIIPAPKPFAAPAGGGKLPPIEGYSNVVCSAYRQSDKFLAECMSLIDRRSTERKKKYLKKYAALNLNSPLPFYATGAAILHHVERIIVREDRESTWREEHKAAVKLFREIETYCVEQFTNPLSLELLRETRTILLDEQTVPAAPMYPSRLLKLLPPTALLLDEVVTVASHLAALYHVTRNEAVAFIRERAASFVEDHTRQLEAKLARSAVVGPNGGPLPDDPADLLLAERPFGATSKGVPFAVDGEHGCDGDRDLIFSSGQSFGGDGGDL